MSKDLYKLMKKSSVDRGCTITTVSHKWSFDVFTELLLYVLLNTDSLLLNALSLLK